jgi:lipid-A-disaccharide synthase
MVTFYRVTGLSWFMGTFLVRVPFYSMVNLVAERKIVPELMQQEMTGEHLATATLALLNDPAACGVMRDDLAEVAARLGTRENPIERAADLTAEFLLKDRTHVS